MRQGSGSPVKYADMGLHGRKHRGQIGLAVDGAAEHAAALRCQPVGVGVAAGWAASCPALSL